MMTYYVQVELGMYDLTFKSFPVISCLIAAVIFLENDFENLIYFLYMIPKFDAIFRANVVLNADFSHQISITIWWKMLLLCKYFPKKNNPDGIRHKIPCKTCLIFIRDHKCPGY